MGRCRVLFCMSNFKFKLAAIDGEIRGGSFWRDERTGQPDWPASWSVPTLTTPKEKIPCLFHSPLQVLAAQKTIRQTLKVKNKVLGEEHSETPISANVIATALA